MIFLKEEVTILIAEDDQGHAQLIIKNLKRAGITNEIIHFFDGQQVIDFLFRLGEGQHRKDGSTYLLLCDIRMPKLDGVKVLEKLKNDSILKKMPVIMITTTDEPREIERCHALGCNSYITKPVEYEGFVNAIRQLGLFLTIVKVPTI